MGRKSRKRKVELLSAESIRGILTGDSVALGELVVNKMNYVKTVIRNYADRNGIELDPDTVDDLASVVWSKFFSKRVRILKDFR